MKKEDLADIRKIYSQLAKSTPDVILVAEYPDLDVLYVSEPIEQLAGFTPAEAARKSLADLLAPASLELALAQIRKELARKGTERRERLRELELELRKSDGTLVLTGVNISFIRNRGATPFGIVCLFRDISDRVHAENALVRSNMLYTAFTEISPDAIFMFDGSGKIINANRQACFLIREKIHDLLGKHYRDYICGGETELLSVLPDMIAQMGQVSEIQLSIRRSDGKILSVLVSVSVILNEEGAIEAMLAVCRDITRQYASERALRESEENMTALLNATHDAATLVAMDGTILAINDIAAILPMRNQQAIAGKSPADIIGSSIYDYIPKKIMRGFQKIVKHLAVDGHPIRSRFEWNNRMFDTTLYPVCDRGGTVTRFALFGRDVTMQHKAEQALKYRAEFEGIITAIASTFINLLPTDLDAGILNALKTIAEFEGIDRIYVYLADATGTNATCSHEWSAPDILPVSKQLSEINTTRFPWATKKIMNFETIHFPDLKRIPPEAEKERLYMEDMGVKSFIMLPLVIREQLIGLIGLDSIRQYREWSQDGINLLKMFSLILVNTMESKKAEKELLDIFVARLSEREIQLLRFFADGFAWPVDKRLLGKKMDVLPGTLDKFMARIKEKMHTDDFETILKVAKMHFKRPAYAPEGETPAV